MQTCNDCIWFRKGDGVLGLEYHCVKPDNIFEDGLNCGVPIPLDPFTAFSDVKGKCLMFREKKEENSNG